MSYTWKLTLCLGYLLSIVYADNTATTNNQNATQNSSECGSNEWALCGCQAIPTDQIPGMTQLYHQNLPCQSLCGQRTCQQDCTSSACSYEMGSLGELCTTTILNEGMLHFVRSASCSVDGSTNAYRCTRGSSVAFPDAQTYRAITQGHCVPSCNLDVSRFQCTFEPRFREETIVKEEDIPTMPLMTITGTGFPGVDSLSPSPTEPSTSTSPETEPIAEQQTKGSPKPESEGIKTTVVTSPSTTTDGTPDAPKKESGATTQQSPTKQTEPETDSTAAKDEDGQSEDDLIVVHPITNMTKSDTSPVEASPSSPAQPSFTSPAEASLSSTAEASLSTPAEASLSSTAEASLSTPAEASLSSVAEPSEIAIAEASELFSAEAPSFLLAEVSEISPIEASIPEVDDLEESDIAPEPFDLEIYEDYLVSAIASEPAELEDFIEATPSSITFDDDSGFTVEDMYDEDEEDDIVESPEISTAPISSEESDGVESDSPDVRRQSNYTLYFSPFGECTQVCSEAGPSYKERFVSCRNSVGIPVAIDLCSAPPNLLERTFIKCQNEQCGPDYYIILTDWSGCNNTCTSVTKNGTLIPNLSTRDFECRRVVDKSLVDKSECDALVVKLDVQLERECNTRPCDRYRYAVSDWGLCECDTWTQQREITCTRLTGGREVNASLCEAFGLDKPLDTRSCYPQDCFENRSRRRLLQAELDFCDFTSCSKRGKCKEQQCSCRHGFDGPHCQIDNRNRSRCPLPSLLDSSGNCCASGVFDLVGNCCDGLNSETDIDVDGKCCAGRALDACGRCGRTTPNFLDATGQCCEAIDAAGACCSSNSVDGCGVCDGFGLSCNTSISFTINVESTKTLNRCLRRVRNVVDNVLGTTDSRLMTHEQGTRRIGLSKTNVAFSMGFITFRLNSAMENIRLDNDCTIEDFSVEQFSVCGNGVCEVGEIDSCPRDCDVKIEICPLDRGRFGQLVTCSGHGLCSFVDASQCSCFLGYSGENCANCSDGFFHVGNDTRCITGDVFSHRPLPSSVDVPSPRQPVEGRPFTASTFSTDRSTVETNSSPTDDRNLIAVTSATAAFFFVFITVVTVLVAVRRKRKATTEEETDTKEAGPSGTKSDDENEDTVLFARADGRHAECA